MLVLRCSEAHGSLCTRFSISGYPTLLLLRDDKYYKFGGNRGKDELLEFVQGQYEENAAESGDLPSEGAGSGVRAITKPIYRLFAKLGMENMQKPYKIMIIVVLAMLPCCCIIYLVLNTGDDEEED